MKELREALGLTQQELAVLLGASMMTISRWERGVRPMSLTAPQMLAMLDVLSRVNWPMDEFLRRQIAYEQMAQSA